MAAIKIADLGIPGSELFSDSESYLDVVTDSDALSIKGGTTLWCLGVGAAALSFKIVNEWTR